MKKVLFLTPLAVAALTGCAPKADRIRDGQWETSVQLTGIDLPNATPEQQAQIRRQLNVDEPQPAQCVTRERAQTFLRDLRGEVPPGCQVGEEVYGGGVIRTAITCAAQPGRPAVTFRIDGTFTATTMNATISEEATPPNGQGPMRRTRRIHGHRVGDCPAGAATPTLPGQPPAGL